MSFGRKTLIIYFAPDGELLSWRVDNVAGLEAIAWDKQGKIYNVITKDFITAKDQIQEYEKYLHPYFYDFIKHSYDKTSFDFLYFLKSAHMNKEFIVNNAPYDSQPDLRTYVITPYSNDGLVIEVDELITRLRRKNKTYITDKKIHTEIEKIMKECKGLAKEQILKSFIDLYERQKSKVLSRSVLVEIWVNLYIKKHKKNPFDLLSQQRVTSCLRIFNPKETSSIKFFKKLMRGEKISDDLQYLLDCTLQKAGVDKNGIFYQPNPANK